MLSGYMVTTLHFTVGIGMRSAGLGGTDLVYDTRGLLADDFARAGVWAWNGLGQ